MAERVHVSHLVRDVYLGCHGEGCEGVEGAGDEGKGGVGGQQLNAQLPHLHRRQATVTHQGGMGHKFCLLAPPTGSTHLRCCSNVVMHLAQNGNET